MSNDELEFRDIFILFLKRSWIVVIAAGVAGWLGHRNAQKMPNQYRSTALLVPAATTSGGRGGVSLGGVGSATASSPDLALYQALMTSRTVMQEILWQPIQTSGDLAPRLVATIMGVDTADPIGMQLAAQNLANGVSLYDQGDGIIRVSYTSSNQELAPQMTEMVLTMTQKQLNRIRSERLTTIIEQLQRSVDEAHRRYTAASSALAKFKDANIEMESGRLQARLSELESDLKVREDDYNTARQRANQMRLELDQLYPPAVVFDPPSRPALLVGPNRQGKVMLAVFAGLLVGVGLIVFTEFLLRKRRE
ncbi:MAG TPA: hypothetical protein PKO15_17515 [Fibrobacteria bacterium]|nr:hypothetical protein [Fibrobacteria bacterium]